MDSTHLPGFLGSTDLPQTALPTEYPNDDIYPVFALDSADWNRKFITRCMRFNDVLDADRLNDSLSRLFDIGDWRKLGGRFKLRDDGTMEIHVPKRFTPERPAIKYTHQIIDTPISLHPLANQMPVATEAISMQELPEELEIFEAYEDQPARLKETFHTDHPQFSLHITSFTDATLVATSFPHASMDGFGSLDILKNWSLVLAGRENEVSPFLGANEDALLAAENACSPEEVEPWLLEDSCIQAYSFVWMIAKLVWEKLSRPGFEKKVIYLPRDKLDRLVAQTREEAVATVGDGGTQSPFVSEADVLAAFVARSISHSDAGMRPVTVVGALNARFRFPELVPKIGTYVQNMVAATYAVFSSRDLQGTLGAVALQHRQSVVKQSSKPQILALLTRMRLAISRNVTPPVFFGSTDSIHVIVNNLVKLDLQRVVDFGPAVVRAGESSETRNNPPGTVTFWYNNWRKVRAPLIPSFYVLGRDWEGKGNYWCVGSFRAQTWKLIEETLAAL